MVHPELKKLELFEEEGRILSHREILENVELLTPMEAAAILRIRKTKMYRLIRDNVVQSIRAAGDCRVRSRSILALIGSAKE